MAIPSYTSSDESYFLGCTNPTFTAYGEDLHCKDIFLLDEARNSNCCYHEEQHHPSFPSPQDPFQFATNTTSPQESQFLSVDPASYSQMPDQLQGGIPIPGATVTGAAGSTIFSPFSTSDDSLYSLSPENDSFFNTSSTSPFPSAATPLSLADPYILDTMYYHQPLQQQQPDFLLEDLLMFQPVSVMDTTEPLQEMHPMVIETSADALSPTPSAVSMLPLAADTSAAGDTRKQQRRPRLHRCLHCPHTSNRANNMKEHMLTHDPNRPKKFPCPLCGKRFARKHDMKRHAKSPHPTLAPPSPSSSSLASSSSSS